MIASEKSEKQLQFQLDIWKRTIDWLLVEGLLYQQKKQKRGMVK